MKSKSQISNDRKVLIHKLIQKCRSVEGNMMVWDSFVHGSPYRNFPELKNHTTEISLGYEYSDVTCQKFKDLISHTPHDLVLVSEWIDSVICFDPDDTLELMLRFK